MDREYLTTSISEEDPYLLFVVYDEAPLVHKTPQFRIRSLALLFVRLPQEFFVMRRPAAVADALFLLVVVFQGIARAGAAEDAAAPPAVVPPSRHREDALAAEAGLRGGVGDPELVFIGVGAHPC